MDVQTSNKIVKHFKLECKIYVRRKKYKPQEFRSGNLDETFRMKKEKLSD